MPDTPEPTISWDRGSGTIRFIDQTLLPERCEVVSCGTVERLILAISRLEVRGAPALGVAGGMGVALAAGKCRAATRDAFLREVEGAAARIAATRPTARNLFFALERMKKASETGKNTAAIKQALIDEAVKIHEEEADATRHLSLFGAELLKDG